MVVVALDRAVGTGRGGAVEGGEQRLLGPGLADRTGDADDLPALRARDAWARSPSAFVVSATRTWGMTARETSGRPRRRRAPPTNLWPSVAPPFIAMNRSPSPISRDRSGAGGVEIAVNAPPVASAISTRSTAYSCGALRATVTSSKEAPCRRRSGPAVTLPARRTMSPGPARSRRGWRRGGRQSPRRRCAAMMARRIAAGSLRGLSSVTITRSASRAATAPISARLPRSRSPPVATTRPAAVRALAAW